MSSELTKPQKLGCFGWLGIIIILGLIIGGFQRIAGCDTDDNEPEPTRATQIYRPPSAGLGKDTAERLCALEHGVPKWWRPDRDYHNCVDRMK